MCGRGSASVVADRRPSLARWWVWNSASPPDGVPASGAYRRISRVTARCPPREASANGVWPSARGMLDCGSDGGKRQGEWRREAHI